MPVIPATQRSLDVLARVDAQRCTACGECAEVCPTGAITLAETATVDEAQCVGCGACAEVCPVEAISLAEAPPGPVDVR